MSCNLGLDALFNSLHHLSDKLTELVTSQKFDADDYGFERGENAGRTPPFQQHHDLSSMISLRTLVVPYASLLRWLPQNHEMFDWGMILPTSIRHVTFTDDLYENFMPNGWDDNILIPVFDDLASSLAPGRIRMQSHNLRCVFSRWRLRSTSQYARDYLERFRKGHILYS
jgi:hypothetical protein